MENTREEFADDAEEGTAEPVGALDFEDFEFLDELKLLRLRERGRMSKIRCWSHGDCGFIWLRSHSFFLKEDFLGGGVGVWRVDNVKYFWIWLPIV